MHEQKEYVRSTQAWYFYPMVTQREWVEEVYFYNDEPFGEMVMRWYDLGGGDLSPRLEVYVQSAHALATLTDVLAGLAHFSASSDGRMSPQQFCVLLEECGFVDKTPHTYLDSYPNR